MYCPKNVVIAKVSKKHNCIVITLLFSFSSSQVFLMLFFSPYKFFFHCFWQLLEIFSVRCFSRYIQWRGKNRHWLV